MARSNDQVFAIADALENRGVTPTLELLRREIGSGSYGGLALSLDLWRESRPASRKVNEPPAIQYAEASVGKLAADRDELATIADALEGDVERLEADLLATRKELEATKGSLALYKERLAATEARLGEQELRVIERLAEIQRLTAQNADLHRTLVAALKAFKPYSSALSELSASSDESSSAAAD